MIKDIKKAVIIVPHPDDETLAAGGTLLLFKKKKIKTSSLIISGHLPPLYSRNHYETIKQESIKAYKSYNISNYFFCDIPATEVNQIKNSKLNKIIFDFIQKNKPDILLIPFPDRHIDHRVIFESCMVASRPNTKFFPRIIMTYETLSETHWNAPNIEPNFVPNFFVDISEHISQKIKILSYYKSQIKNNDTRSKEAINALARFRGSQNGSKYAEAFQVIRFVI